MNETQIIPDMDAESAGKSLRPTFPDPSLSLIEFGDALSLLLAERTERDVANRRLILKKVAYIRIKDDGWGVSGYPELWIEQNAEQTFQALEPKTGKILRYPSRRRYEVSFLTRDIFDCAIQCIKERQPDAIYELVLVTFGTREEFSVEANSLVGPGDYATERNLEPGREWLATPPLFEAGRKAGG